MRASINEHTNGLIWQYLSKQTDLTKVKRREIKEIQNSFKHRPRKSLGYKTPFEVFYAKVTKVLVA